MRGTAWVAAVVFACAWGCGDDDGGASSETITQLVGPAGGTVELASGGKVTIPADALSVETPIKITKLEPGEVAAVPSNLEAAGKPYAFEPHGITFARPVRIEVPYEGAEAEVRPIKLDDEDDTTWQTIVGSEKDDATKQLAMDTTSFSVILAARPRRGSGVITLPDGAIVGDGGIAGEGGSAGSAGSAGTGGSGGASGTGGTGGTGGAAASNAAAYYPSFGADWNDYVASDGADVLSATDTACDPMTDGPGYDGCIHGGEIRAFDITGQTSCAGLMIHDNLDAFTWTCVTGNPVRAVSTHLNTGRYLSDLIDFATPAWRTNFITVSDSSENVVFTSTPAVWWDNPVVADNDGIAVGETSAGTVYVVTQDVTADYSINSSKTAFVVQPGRSITPVLGQYAALYLGDPNSSDPIDFNWIEGTVNGNNGTGISGNEHRFSMLRHITAMPPLVMGLSVYCAKSKIVDFHSTDTTTGIGLPGKECTIDGARIENTAIGIQTLVSFSDSATGPNTIENVVIEGSSTFVNGQAGILIGNQTPGTTIRNVTITNPSRVGLEVSSANNVLSDITITDTSGNLFDAIVLNGTGNTIDGVTIEGGTNRGIVVSGYGQRINNAKLSQMGSWAIELGGYEHRISNVVASRVGSGLRLFNVYRTRVWNVMVGNTGNPTHGGNGTGIETTFTGGSGSEALRSDNIFSNVYLVNNGLVGFVVGGSQSNVFQTMTVANTGHVSNISTGETPAPLGGRGFRFSTSFIKGNSFNNLLVASNADSGLDVDPHITGTAIDWVENTQFNNLAVVGNGTRDSAGTGIRLGEYAVDVVFTGELLLANNGQTTDRNCHVTNDGTPKTEAGLIDSSMSFACTPVGSSTATLDIAISGYGGLGGISTDDSANQSDVNGQALFSAVMPSDWTRFDDLARMWGRAGSLFPNDDNWGMCRATESCRIYDFRPTSNDTDYLGVLPIPTGNDVLVHQFWAVDEATCNAVPATWNGDACVSTHLINAREIMDDGLGNENTLCESGETCLYTPNFGAYQGHGALISAGTFTPGTVTGVTLMRYAENGR